MQTDTASEIYRDGGVEIAVYPREYVADGETRTFNQYQIHRRFLSMSGEWKSTDRLSFRELLRLRTLIDHILIAHEREAREE